MICQQGCDKATFQAIAEGGRTFTFVDAGASVAVGDYVALNEVRGSGGEETGRCMLLEITYLYPGQAAEAGVLCALRPCAVSAAGMNPESGRRECPVYDHPQPPPGSCLEREAGEDPADNMGGASTTPYYAEGTALAEEEDMGAPTGFPSSPLGRGRAAERVSPSPRTTGERYGACEDEPLAEDGLEEETVPAEQVGPPSYLLSREYDGFLYLRCEHCGETRAFCARQPIRDYRCAFCGGVTPLGELAEAKPVCECGNRSRYMTNIGDRVIDIPCVRCGSPMELEYRDGRYLPIRKPEMPRKGGNRKERR